MRVRCGSLILLSIVLQLVPSAAHGCSCMSSGPACQAFWRTDAVFDATVIAIVKHPRSGSLEPVQPIFNDRIVTLQIHRSWKGAQPGEVQVGTSDSGASCGFEFEVGTRYLVFAFRGTGEPGLKVTHCSLTQRFDPRSDAARFLDSLAGVEPGGRVLGTVRTWPGMLDPGGPREIATEVGVRLSGAGTSQSTRSRGGNYEFAGLAPGAYTVEVDVPEGYATYSRLRTVEIPNARACAEENYGFSANGRIAGQVIGADGKPIENVRIEVARSDARPHPDYGLSTSQVTSDRNGFFELTRLGPGRYIVGVNLKDLPNQYNPYGRTLYPGAGFEPDIIELALGQAIDLGTWRLPLPLPTTRIEGIVVRTDGAPVAEVFVGSWDETGNPVERARGAGSDVSGPDGRFVLELRQGREYTFTARRKGGQALRIEPLRLATEQRARVAIRIVVLEDR